MCEALTFQEQLEIAVWVDEIIHDPDSGGGILVESEKHLMELLEPLVRIPSVA